MAALDSGSRDAVAGTAAAITAGLNRAAEQTGLLVGSAMAPGTFARSLGPRSALDQGLVTGLATTLHYVLTVAAQDALEAAGTAGMVEATPGDVRRRALLANAAAIPAGIALHQLLAPRDDEHLLRSLARQVCWRTAVTGAGGLLFAGAQTALGRIDQRVGAGGRLTRFPIAVPTGVLVAAALELQRRRTASDQSARPAVSEVRSEQPGQPEEQGQESHLESEDTNVVAALGTGAGVAAGLVGVAVAEHALASSIGRLLSRRLPGSARTWRLSGHALTLLVMGGGVHQLWLRAMQRIESGTSAVDPILEGADHRWAMPTCSGSEHSLVPWDTLGREGRRHAIAVVRPQAVADRPAGTPDLSIATVMKRPAVADPVQVYVGLDSAPTMPERVDLALAEMDRTGAWDRSLLMLISPTGTGYVNYCATAAVEYLSLGDVATVTMQYSKRPSPLSLGKVAAAREQNRLLWLQIAQRVRDMSPDRRPRVVVFGESLGAHTSQDVFIHWGTLGPEALGIDRALWVGTPALSRWMQQVTMYARPDTDPDVVAMVNDFDQVRAMPAERQARLRYVLVSHDNDGVTKFGADLLVKAPRWLGEERTPVEIVPPYSPRGIPPSMRWLPLTTFFQLLVDMKNAQTPGAYLASRHDYRPDLTQFISTVYGIPATPDELDRVAAALEERETIRERLFAQKQPFADAPEGQPGSGPQE